MMNVKPSFLWILLSTLYFGLQVLKLYAWEESFMKEIKRIRKKELKYSRNSDLWASGFIFVFGFAPTLVSQ